MSPAAATRTSRGVDEGRECRVGADGVARCGRQRDASVVRVAADSPGMTTVTVWWATGTFNESGAVAWPYAVVGPYSTDSLAPAAPAETVAVSDAWCADHAGDRDGLHDGRRQREGDAWRLCVQRIQIGAEAAGRRPLRARLDRGAASPVIE